MRKASDDGRPQPWMPRPMAERHQATVRRAHRGPSPFDLLTATDADLPALLRLVDAATGDRPHTSLTFFGLRCDPVSPATHVGRADRIVDEDGIEVPAPRTLPRSRVIPTEFHGFVRDMVRCRDVRCANRDHERVMRERVAAARRPLVEVASGKLPPVPARELQPPDKGLQLASQRLVGRTPMRISPVRIEIEDESEMHAVLMDMAAAGDEAGYSHDEQREDGRDYELEYARLVPGQITERSPRAVFSPPVKPRPGEKPWAPQPAGALKATREWFEARRLNINAEPASDRRRGPEVSDIDRCRDIASRLAGDRGVTLEELGAPTVRGMNRVDPLTEVRRDIAIRLAAVFSTGDVALVLNRSARVIQKMIQGEVERPERPPVDNWTGDWSKVRNAIVRDLQSGRCSIAPERLSRPKSP